MVTPSYGPIVAFTAQKSEVIISISKSLLVPSKTPSNPTNTRCSGACAYTDIDKDTYKKAGFYSVIANPCVFDTETANLQGS